MPWIVWFLAFLVIAIGWAILTPVNGYPDESDHVYRAVSVVRGSVLPHTGPHTPKINELDPVHADR